MRARARVCVCGNPQFHISTNLPIIKIKRFIYEKGVKNNLCDATSCAEYSDKYIYFFYCVVIDNL